MAPHVFVALSVILTCVIAVTSAADCGQVPNATSTTVALSSGSPSLDLSGCIIDNATLTVTVPGYSSSSSARYLVTVNDTTWNGGSFMVKKTGGGSTLGAFNLVVGGTSTLSGLVHAGSLLTGSSVTKCSLAIADSAKIIDATRSALSIFASSAMMDNTLRASGNSVVSVYSDANASALSLRTSATSHGLTIAVRDSAAVSARGAASDTQGTGIAAAASVVGTGNLLVINGNKISVSGDASVSAATYGSAGGTSVVPVGTAACGIIWMGTHSKLTPLNMWETSLTASDNATVMARGGLLEHAEHVVGALGMAWANGAANFNGKNSLTPTALEMRVSDFATVTATSESYVAAVAAAGVAGVSRVGSEKTTQAKLDGFSAVKVVISGNSAVAVQALSSNGSAAAGAGVAVAGGLAAIPAPSAAQMASVVATAARRSQYPLIIQVQDSANVAVAATNGAAAASGVAVYAYQGNAKVDVNIGNAAMTGSMIEVTGTSSVKVATTDAGAAASAAGIALVLQCTSALSDLVYTTATASMRYVTVAKVNPGTNISAAVGNVNTYALAAAAAGIAVASFSESPKSMMSVDLTNVNIFASGSVVAAYSLGEMAALSAAGIALHADHLLDEKPSLKTPGMTIEVSNSAKLSASGPAGKAAVAAGGIAATSPTGIALLAQNVILKADMTAATCTGGAGSAVAASAVAVSGCAKVTMQTAPFCPVDVDTTASQFVARNGTFDVKTASGAAAAVGAAVLGGHGKYFAQGRFWGGSAYSVSLLADSVVAKADSTSINIGITTSQGVGYGTAAAIGVAASSTDYQTTNTPVPELLNVSATGTKFIASGTTSAYVSCYTWRKCAAAAVGASAFVFVEDAFFFKPTANVVALNAAKSEFSANGTVKLQTLAPAAALVGVTASSTLIMANGDGTMRTSSTGRVDVNATQLHLNINGATSLIPFTSVAPFGILSTATGVGGVAASGSATSKSGLNGAMSLPMAVNVVADGLITQINGPVATLSDTAYYSANPLTGGKRADAVAIAGIAAASTSQSNASTVSIAALAPQFKSENALPGGSVTSRGFQKTYGETVAVGVLGVAALNWCGGKTQVATANVSIPSATYKLTGGIDVDSTVGYSVGILGGAVFNVRTAYRGPTNSLAFAGPATTVFDYSDSHVDASGLLKVSSTLGSGAGALGGFTHGLIDDATSPAVLPASPLVSTNGLGTTINISALVDVDMDGKPTSSWLSLSGTVEDASGSVFALGGFASGAVISQQRQAPAAFTSGVVSLVTQDTNASISANMPAATVQIPANVSVQLQNAVNSVSALAGVAASVRTSTGKALDLPLSLLTDRASFSFATGNGTVPRDVVALVAALDFIGTRKSAKTLGGIAVPFDALTSSPTLSASDVAISAVGAMNLTLVGNAASNSAGISASLLGVALSSPSASGTIDVVCALALVEGWNSSSGGMTPVVEASTVGQFQVTKTECPTYAPQTAAPTPLPPTPAPLTPIPTAAPTPVPSTQTSAPTPHPTTTPSPVVTSGAPSPSTAQPTAQPATPSSVPTPTSPTTPAPTSLAPTDQPATTPSTTAAGPTNPPAPSTTTTAGPTAPISPAPMTGTPLPPAPTSPSSQPSPAPTPVPQTTTPVPQGPTGQPTPPAATPIPSGKPAAPNSGLESPSASSGSTTAIVAGTVSFFLLLILIIIAYLTYRRMKAAAKNEESNLEEMGDSIPINTV